MLPETPLLAVRRAILMLAACVAPGESIDLLDSCGNGRSADTRRYGIAAKELASVSDHIEKTIVQAQEKLRAQEAGVSETKKLINQLLAFAEQPPMYPDVADTSAVHPLRGDEYYGLKQQAACRLVLERRKALSLGPATLDEIFATLTEGGYRYEAKSVEVAKKSIYNMLVQNSSTFHRLPTGKFGLSAWYPGAKPQRRRLHLDDEEPDKADGEPAEDAAEEGGTP